MAKTTKRFAAILLAVMMLVAMIPSAFAATSYSFTLSNTNAGYTYDVYKVAEFDETTGAYTVVSGVDSAVATAVAASTASSANLLDALNAATNVGTKLESFTSTSSATSKTYSNLTGGIYYVKGVGTPVADATITKNNVIVLDANTTTTTVDLTDKTHNGSDPTITKTFGDGTTAEKIVGTDTTITYVLTADVTGTAQNKLDSFVITDNMDLANLSLEDVAIVSVKLDNTDINYSKTNTSTGFKIAVADTELAKDSFYDGSKVVVTFTTNLTATAKAGVDIPNYADLDYKYVNESESRPTQHTDRIYVKTFEVKVTKVDAQTQATITDSEATFALYEADGTTLIETKQTTNGVVTFDTRLTDGTYYVKETVAPQGYNLNSEPQKVVISGSSSATTLLTVEDTKTKLPETGGAGTMMFTIGGAALILAAGVLFVVVMRKRAAK